MLGGPFSACNRKGLRNKLLTLWSFFTWRKRTETHNDYRFQIHVSEGSPLRGNQDWIKCSINNQMPLHFSGLVISFGYSGFIPAIHLIAEYGLTLAYRQAAGGWVALMCLLYTASAVMYATRIPERFFPGKCDIWVSRTKKFHFQASFPFFVSLIILVRTNRQVFWIPLRALALPRNGFDATECIYSAPQPVTSPCAYYALARGKKMPRK